MRLTLPVVLVVALVSSAGGQTTRPTTRPNVVVIMADDMGFSDPGCFGGEIHTPNIDKLAAGGMRMTQFYNCARCCPSRASLMTGLYPTQAGVGAMNQDLGVAEYEGVINRKCVTTAEVLRGAGYHTGMVGKWHLCHLNISTAGGAKARKLLNFEEDGPISPMKLNWPCNRGFEEHWGTIAGVENYYDPYSLVHNETPIRPDKPDFYYTDFIADHAAGLVDQFSGDGKPFYLYVAFTAPHWPMQARDADVERYKDTYTAGWDKIRQARFERQIALGVCKKEWGLSPRSDYKGLNNGPSAQSAWEDAPDKPWQARRMAVYAAMVETMDRGIGRITGELRAKGLDQNTIVIFLSDNGACAENVEASWYDVGNKTRDGRAIHVGNDPAFMPGPQTVYQSYGPAWANVSNTPFRRFKHWTEEGGISAPFIVRWPGVVKPARLETDQFGHITDLMPTILDVAGATYPATFQGRSVTPVEGKSLTAIFKGATIDRGPVCWEHEGNRAIRLGDWKLLAAHNEPWQLYNVAADRDELHDVASSEPDKVAEMKTAYEGWATRVGVKPWPVRR